MIRLRWLTGGLIAALAIGAVSQADAQDKFNAPAAKIAIVDMQAILRESSSSKSVRKQMEAIARKEQAALAAEEQKLRAQDQELQQQRALLAPEAFTQRQQALQADVGRLQQKSRALRVTLDRGLNNAMAQIQQKMLEELGKLSKELDLNLILPRSQIVLAVDGFDITKQALERLNKRLPSIELKLDKSEASSKAK